MSDHGIYANRERRESLFRHGRKHIRMASGRHDHGPSPVLTVVGFFLGLGVIAATVFFTYRVYRQSHPDTVSGVQLGALTIDRPVSTAPELDGSTAAIRRAMEASEKSRLVFSEAEMLAGRGLVREAGDKLERHLRAYPEQIETRLRLAGYRLRLRQYDAAGALLLEVLRADPQNAGARLLLADVLIGKNEFAGAYEAAKWTLELLPGDPDALKIAGRAAIRAGWHQVALDHLRDLSVTRRSDIECRGLLALCYLRLGEYGKAVFQLNEIVREGKADESVYYNLAVSYAQQKQPQDVVDVITRAAAQVGDAKAMEWLRDDDFLPVRESPLFAALVQQLGHGASPSIGLASGKSAPSLGILPSSSDITVRSDVVSYRKY